MTSPVSPSRVSVKVKPPTFVRPKRRGKRLQPLHVTNLYTGPIYVNTRAKKEPTSPGIDLGPPPPEGTWKRWGYDILKMSMPLLQMLGAMIVFIAGRASFGVVKQLGPK